MVSPVRKIAAYLSLLPDRVLRVLAGAEYLRVAIGDAFELQRNHFPQRLFGLFDLI